MCAKGAMSNLKELHLNQNQIGDLGMSSLSEALAKGALANLTLLTLRQNQIGDAGLSALAKAIITPNEDGKGAMATLSALYVDDGPLGTEHPKLKAACQARGISLESM